MINGNGQGWGRYPAVTPSGNQVTCDNQPQLYESDTRVRQTEASFFSSAKMGLRFPSKSRTNFVISQMVIAGSLVFSWLLLWRLSRPCSSFLSRFGAIKDDLTIDISLFPPHGYDHASGSTVAIDVVEFPCPPRRHGCDVVFLVLGRVGVLTATMTAGLSLVISVAVCAKRHASK